MRKMKNGGREGQKEGNREKVSKFGEKMEKVGKKGKNWGKFGEKRKEVGNLGKNWEIWVKNGKK